MCGIGGVNEDRFVGREEVEFVGLWWTISGLTIGEQGAWCKGHSGYFG